MGMHERFEIEFSGDWEERYSGRLEVGEKPWVAYEIAEKK
jgi:hypothetical protein